MQTKRNLFKREQQLLAKLAETQQQLDKLREKRKQEIANLAFKHQLHQIDNVRLNEAFAMLAKELQA